MKRQKRSMITSIIAMIIMISILGVVWYICYLAMYSIPINYLKPFSTAMLFVLLVNAYGGYVIKSRAKSSETKDKK